MSKKVSFFSLIILIVASIDNMKNLPAAALMGGDLLVFFPLAALIFLLPTALISAELSAAYPTEGGIYKWVGMAFGKKWAFVAIWLQWINTMIWYPTMLAFIASSLAYIINPTWAQNKAYLAMTSLAIFWALTALNLRGIRISTLLNNSLALAGIVFPLLILIFLGFLWFINGHPMHIEFKKGMLNLSQSTSWISLIAILASFLGMELSSVHVNDIRNPQKNFPKALLCACAFILLSMGGGALAIAVVLPGQEINLVSGIMQVFASIFQAFGLSQWTPFLTCLIAGGSIGTMINWIISPAKGLLESAADGFLPSFFARKNRYGVASNILITQAILVSLFSLFFLLEPNVTSYFWFLTALSTELYMLMYLLMFSSALILRYRNPIRAVFQIPGGNYGLIITCGLGILGSLATIIVSFLPSTNLENGESWHYLLKIGLGNVIALSPIILFYLYSKLKKTVIET